MRGVVRRLLKAMRLARTPLYRAAMSRGAAATIEHEPFLNMLKAALVVDIGSNKGQFALASRHHFPAARIVSFEPLNNPAAVFRRVFAGDDNTVLYQVAIGPQSGEHQIHVSAREDSSSLLPLTDLQDKIFPGTRETHTETIRIAPLTTFLSAADVSQPALLKIDVQGFELAALEGCGELLPLFENIYVECSFLELYAGQALAGDVIVWLEQRGFQLAGIYNLAADPRGLAVQADFYFRRR